MRKYLIIGTGGVGGSIAGFLALGGKDVTCIARGEHLKTIRREGLHLRSGLKGDRVIPVKACTADEYREVPDVVFVCVKGYSMDSIRDLLKRVATPRTVVIPILNVYGTGARIASLAPKGSCVLDGCIYIVGYVERPGVVVQTGKTFRIVYGVRPGQTADTALLDDIADELRSCGIKVDVSDNIDRDTFIKWTFISAMACTGACFGVPMGALQHPGEPRLVFAQLTGESAETGRRLGIDLPDNLPAANLHIIDKLDPNTTASMQKDLARGHESEIEGLLFQMLDLGEKMGVHMKTYRQVADRLINRLSVDSRKAREARSIVCSLEWI